MMKIFPGMTLEAVKGLNWLDANTLVACHNNEMRELKYKRESEARRIARRRR